MNSLVFCFLIKIGLIMSDETNNSEKRNGIGFWGTLQSTIAAACGVQTQANRERDFAHAKPSTFIFAGIAFVVVFILAMYGVVQLVLSVASPA